MQTIKDNEMVYFNFNKFNNFFANETTLMITFEQKLQNQQFSSMKIFSENFLWDDYFDFNSKKDSVPTH